MTPRGRRADAQTETTTPAPVAELPLETTPEAAPAAPPTEASSTVDVVNWIDEQEAQATMRLQQQIKMADRVDELGVGKWFVPDELRPRLRGYHFVRLPVDNRYGIYEQTRQHLRGIGYMPTPPGVFPIGFPHDARAAYLMCNQEQRRRNKAKKLRKVAEAKRKVGQMFQAGAKDIEGIVGNRGSVEFEEKTVR